MWIEGFDVLKLDLEFVYHAQREGNPVACPESLRLMLVSPLAPSGLGTDPSLKFTIPSTGETCPHAKQGA
jgi:hypothetical protein